MRKKRHIRWDRVGLLLILLYIVVSQIICFTSMATYKKDNDVDYTKYKFTDMFKQSININKAIELPELPEKIYIGEFKLTGYCNCVECCGKWSGGPTASGVMPISNHTIAVDPDVIPLGSVVIINGIRYTAEDTGSAIIGNKIDIYCDTHEECYNEKYNGVASVYLIIEE